MKKKSALHFLSSITWAIHDSNLNGIIEIAQRLNDKPDALENKLDMLAAQAGERVPETKYSTIRGNVGVLNVIGPVFRYANLFTEYSGATSLNLLVKEFAKLESDDSVTNIVLNIDSPGGQAPGISEFASIIKRSKKPVTAYVDGMAASAAYWIASAAKEIVISDTSELGSIGAVLGVDAKEDDGFVKIISSQSPLKQASPSTEDGRTELQNRIDSLAQIFIETVAENRNVTVETVLSDFGRGGIKVGADAVNRGMADRISTFEEVIAGLVAGNFNHNTGGHVMSEKQTPSKPEMTVDVVRADYPDIAQALIDEGRNAGVEEGRKQGAKAESDRINAVRDQGKKIPGHEKLVESLMFDGETNGPDAAVKILAAEEQSRKKIVDDLEEEAPEALDDPDTDIDTGAEATGTIEERAKAKWDKDSEIRAEFKSFSTFLAYYEIEDAKK